MKTLVFVSIPGAVLSLEASDFPGCGPQSGRSYEFEGKLYRAAEIVETLGFCDSHGSRVSADLRVLQFAEAIAGDNAELKAQILKAKPIGKNAGEESRSSGGIIIPAESSKASLASSYEKLIFLRCEPAEAKNSRLASLRPLKLASGADSDAHMLQGADGIEALASGTPETSDTQ